MSDPQDDSLNPMDPEDMGDLHSDEEEDDIEKDKELEVDPEEELESLDELAEEEEEEMDSFDDEDHM